MRILITNDDGINAPGLSVLHDIATEIAGEGGEVWTVAPTFEQSGVGHCISYTRPMMISQLGERRYSVDGSPADCVLAAIHDVLAQTPPDLVLSGVNRGNNSAENAAYSGTIGAAMEAALQGLPAIALSQYLSAALLESAAPFSAAAAHGADVVRRILASDMPARAESGYQVFYNVNFPPVLAEQVSGVEVCGQGRRKDVRFSLQRQKSPTGRSYLWITGGAQTVPSAPGTDAQANLNGMISITPMCADFTAHNLLSPLRGAFEK